MFQFVPVNSGHLKSMIPAPSSYLIHSIRSSKVAPHAQSARRVAFTLIELLVVIAIIAILASILLPVLAKARRTSQRTVCINNMKEMGAGSFMYAGDFNDYYPITTIGAGDAGGKINELEGVHYTRYIVGTDESATPNVSAAPYTRVPASYQPYDQNLGLLYAGGQCGNPAVFYCPSLLDTNLTESPYSDPAFMSTDSGGNVRSSYMFNPRDANANSESAAGYLRKYQKTSSVKQLDIFILDYLENNSASGATTPIPFNVQDWAHWPSRGLVTCFTDGSARFVQFTPQFMNIVLDNLITVEGSLQSQQQYDQIFTTLQTSQ